jgi:YbbR domain-containing protein
MRSIANFIPQFVKNMSLGRFIVSICLAIIVWGYVIVSQYPERTLPPFEVPLAETIPPPSELEVVPTEGQNNPIRVILSGPSDTVTTVTPGQVKPYLDLSQYRQPGTYYVKLNLKQALPQYVNAKLEPDTIPVTLESRISKTVPVEIVKQGDVNPDYTLEGDLVPSPTQVTITGRQSLVDRVAKAQVPVNLAGRVGSLRLTQAVNLVDTRSQAITDTGLTITPSTVSVAGNIVYKLTTRTVPIRVVTTGEPAPGYIAGNAQATPLLATVVSGNQDALNKLEFISTDPINISGASSLVSTTVHLQKIPDITFTGSDTVKVNIGIVPFQTSKTILVPLELLNPASNLRYSYEPTNVNLTISGPYQAFQPELPLDKIKATVNVQDRGVGNYTVPVQVELPSNLVVTNSPTVKVSINLPVVPTPTPIPTLAPLPTPTPAPTRTVAPTITPGVSASPSPPAQTPGTSAPKSVTTTVPSNPAGTPAPDQTPAPSAPTAAVAPEKFGAAPPQSPGATTTPAAQPSPQTAQPGTPATQAAPTLQTINWEKPSAPTRHSIEFLYWARSAPSPDRWLAGSGRSSNLL